MHLTNHFTNLGRSQDGLLTHDGRGLLAGLALKNHSQRNECDDEQGCKRDSDFHEISLGELLGEVTQVLRLGVTPTLAPIAWALSFPS
jgi:hypothetical protein